MPHPGKARGAGPSTSSTTTESRPAYPPCPADGALAAQRRNKPRSHPRRALARDRERRNYLAGSPRTSSSPLSNARRWSPAIGAIPMAVTSLESRASIVLEGRPFGEVGLLREDRRCGCAWASNPATSEPGRHDLALFARNAPGSSESASDFYLLCPSILARQPPAPPRHPEPRPQGRARMFNSTSAPDPTSGEEFATGSLMRHGYPSRGGRLASRLPLQDGLLALTVPVALGDDGPISGPVLC